MVRWSKEYDILIGWAMHNVMLPENDCRYRSPALPVLPLIHLFHISAHTVSKLCPLHFSRVIQHKGPMKGFYQPAVFTEMRQPSLTLGVGPNN